MAVYIPIISEYNDKGSKAAQASLKKLAVGAGIAGIGMQQLGAFMMDASKAAIEDERSQRLLAQALIQNTGATQAQVAAQEAFVASVQDETNVMDDKLRPAFATLARYSKDAAKAQELLRLSMDISAATGKDLGSVSVALGKAYAGNFTALKRLGIPIDENIVKAKDFEAAWSELNYAFAGSQAAVTKAEGALGDLRVAWEDFKEQTGGVVNTIGKPFLELAAGAAEFFNYYIDEVKSAFGVTKQLSDEMLRLADFTRDRAMYDARYRRAQEQAAKDAHAASMKRAAELAKANRVTLREALKKAQDAVKSVRTEMDSYARSVSDAIAGTVSLSNAFAANMSQEQDYNDALAERAAAYEELNAIQARGVDLRTGSRTAQDAADYAAAMEKVAAAEQAVTKTQAQRKSYSQLFAEQIAAAKDFAGALKQLISAGLGRAGLAQLLDLGPVAGAQVAKDMLSGTAGLSVGGVNEALAGLAAVTGDLGAAAGSSAYGGQLASASATAKNVQYALTQDIKVVSNDPDAVVAALVKWAKKNGKLPSVVKVS